MHTLNKLCLSQFMDRLPQRQRCRTVRGKYYLHYIITERALIAICAVITHKFKLYRDPETMHIESYMMLLYWTTYRENRRQAKRPQISLVTLPKRCE